jgi:hypothetical protein
MGRIVKRASAESGDAAGLPVVVVVEAAHPTVVIHRHVEVNLVAGGAEIRRIVLHEGLEEGAAVRLRIFLDEIVDNLLLRP